MNKLFLAIAATLMVGCASTGGVDSNYKAQLESIERQSTARLQVQVAQIQASAAMSSACEKDTNPGLCVAMANLTSVMASLNGGNNQQVQVPSHQVRHHPAWGILGNVLDKGLGLGIPAYYGYKNNQATSEMWSGIIGSVTSQGPTYSIGGNMSQGDMTSVGGNLGNTDNSVNVGGNLGNTDNSVAVGGDQVIGDGNTPGDGNTIGDGNTNVGGDQWNGRDQTNGDANNNSGRIDSPGPYDWSGDNRDNTNEPPCTVGVDC